MVPLVDEEGVGAERGLSERAPFVSPLLSSSFLEFDDDSAAAAASAAKFSAFVFNAATPVLLLCVTVVSYIFHTFIA